MENQSGFGSISRFFSSLVCLLGSLIGYETALSYNGLENHVLADNWGGLLAVLLAITFGLGWWGESRYEDLILTKGRKIATRALLSFVLICALIALGLTIVASSGFLRWAIGAAWFILPSGFNLRLSVARPDVIARMSERNP